MSVMAYRVAIRREGEQIVMYIAQPATMEGAFQVATLKVGAAEVPEVWEAFKEMGRLIAVGLAEGAGLDVTALEFRDAPEHEKAGRA